MYGAIDILQQILNEVKSSNKVIKEKVTQLEKTVNELQQSALSKKKLKLTPSREERVSVLALVVHLVHYAPLCRMLFARCTNHCVIMVMTLAGIWSELYCVILKVCLYLLYNLLGDIFKSS